MNRWNHAMILISLMLVSCRPASDTIMCTEEFRTVTITVTGAVLTSYFTIRESTGDTLRIGQENVPGDTVFPVLDDRYQPVIENRTETFRFSGFTGSNLVVNESFVISADRCHISYVSGKRHVDL